MINVLGHREGKPQLTGYTEALQRTGAGIHIYGKYDVRPRRKMGHVTATGQNTTETRALAEEAADLIQL